MPLIRFHDQTIECERNENLRSVLISAGLPLYSSLGRVIHCRGLGTCGTCAVKIDGDVSKTTAIERWRLGFPPHRHERGLRLACQCRVLGDLQITRLAGLWGTKQDPAR